MKSFSTFHSTKICRNPGIHFVQYWVANTERRNIWVCAWFILRRYARPWFSEFYATCLFYLFLRSQTWLTRSNTWEITYLFRRPFRRVNGILVVTHFNPLCSFWISKNFNINLTVIIINLASQSRSHRNTITYVTEIFQLWIIKGYLFPSRLTYILNLSDSLS